MERRSLNRRIELHASPQPAPGGQAGAFESPENIVAEISSESGLTSSW